MDRYAVVGHPVEHSQSPFVHALFARATGQAIEYGRLACAPDGLRDTLHRFARDGARGCNVTVPFKFEAFQLAPRHSERAALAQAANVLCFDDAGWFADNTDGAGLVRDIECNAAVPLRGRRVLLVGAGGAAAGALGALIRAQPGVLVLANRTPGKAQALASRHGALARACAVDLRASPLDGTGAAFDVIVDATSSSLHGAVTAVPAAALRPGTLVLDMMYGPAARPFLDWSAGQGAVARDGLGMLVEQAAEAFQLWRGVRPDTAPVLAALHTRLAARAAP